MVISNLTWVIIFSFMYIVALSFLYFSKTRLDNGENKIYKYILITNLVGLVLQFLCDFVSYKYDVIPTIISDFVLRLYLVYFIIFISLLIFYLIEISFKHKKIANIITLIGDTLITIVVFMLPYNLHRDVVQKIYYTYGPAVQVVFFLSAILSLVIFAILIAKRKSVGLNKNIQDENGKKGKTSLDSSKVLVVYFSNGGNTQKLAKEIYNQVGGDFRQIKPVKAYPKGNKLYDYTKNEQEKNGRPKLKDLNIDISHYDTIFIGYPIWWYTYPQIILSFFDQYDLSNKTIIPFVTHGGSGMSGTKEDMEEYLKDENVTVKEGLAVSRTDIEKSQKETVEDWLKELGYK